MLRFTAHHLLYNETTIVAVLVMSGIGACSAYFSWCAIRGIRYTSFLFGASFNLEFDMRFRSQEFGQLASMEIPFVESWAGIFFLLASVI